MPLLSLGLIEAVCQATLQLLVGHDMAVLDDRVGPRVEAYLHLNTQQSWLLSVMEIQADV